MNDTHWSAIKDFFPKAKELQSHYMERFSNPLEASEERFVWDYWHVPDQYTLVRTPAYHFFPEDVYEAFEQHLLEWGQKNLGCSEISPPWLSYYVEGCSQQLHADNPHGPWAYVFSLTDWANKEFSGGETEILNPNILNYWSHHSADKGIERDTIVTEIPPEFNQLTVFDPRFPHGVKPVSGVSDPRKARIVIHGWFTDPCLFVTGALEAEQALEALDPQMQELLEKLSEDETEMNGIITAKLSINPEGKTSAVNILTNTVYDRQGQRPAELVQQIQASLKGFQLPQTGGESEITIPLIFE